VTDEELVDLGLWCENVLDSDMFSIIVQQFEQQCFGHWMHTDPEATKERDYIFSKVNALRDFIGHMRAFIDQKDKLSTPSPEEEDASIEGIDY
jgi:hypothetical protein